MAVCHSSKIQGQRARGRGRYYDPKLGRFASADSVVPGSASGQGGMVATRGSDERVKLTPLPTDFHESGFTSGLAREHTGVNPFYQTSE